MKKILIVEDDPHIAGLIQEKLKEEPFDITIEHNGRKAYELALNYTYDIVLLDVMLPDMTGTEICRQLRMNQVSSVIIMLTSKAEEIDKVLGLEFGADDYITKPFSPRELLSRIHARIRRMDNDFIPARPGKDPDKTILRFEGLSIDIEKRKVIRNNKTIELTPREFDLLLLLSSKPGKTYTRSQLLDMVWGSNFEGFEHTVNTHINRLRQKIESDPAKPRYIITTWGIGYKFSE